jgi:hypothetical protein
MAAPDERFVKSVYDNLFRIIAAGPSPLATTSTRFGQVAWDLPRFGFTETGTAAADSLIDKFAKRWPNLSGYSAENAVEQCLAIVERGGKCDPTLDAVKAVIERLDVSIRDYTVLLPVAGVSLGDPEIPAGPIALVKLTDVDIQRFLTAVNDEEHAIRQATQEARGRLRVEISDYYYEARRRALRDELPSMVFLRCNVRGDATRAWELAEQTARQFIDALRFVMAVALPHDPRVGHAAVFGEGGGISMWILFDDGTRPQLHSFLGRGSQLIFPLDHNVMAELTESGIWSVFDLLAVPRTQFQEALLRAVRWLSKAVVSNDNNDALLSATISLESIFTRQPGEPVRQGISEGCAVLLGANVDERLSIKRRVGQLYDSRSSLAHGRDHGPVRLDVVEAIAFAKAIVVKLLPRQHEFEALDDLAKVLERRKFGGG